MNKISIVSLEKRFKKFEKSIKIIAERILKILKKENIEADIYLAGNGKMRFLNKKFRGKDKTADVLSFCEPKRFIYPPLDGGSKSKKIGEIYINPQSSKFSILQLLAHGFLHLFGYHHNKKDDRIKMEKKEKFLISNF